MLKKIKYEYFKEIKNFLKIFVELICKFGKLSNKFAENVCNPKNNVFEWFENFFEPLKSTRAISFFLCGFRNNLYETPKNQKNRVDFFYSKEAGEDF